MDPKIERTAVDEIALVSANPDVVHVVNLTHTTLRAQLVGAPCAAAAEAKYRRENGALGMVTFGFTRLLDESEQAALNASYPGTVATWTNIPGRHATRS